MVTLKDIADRAGVSRATAGLVLSGEATAGRFKADTRRRVQQIAREMGYRSNSSAKAVSTGRFGSVALLLSTVGSRSLLPVDLLDGIHDALAKRDLRLVITRIPDEKLTSEGFVPKILRESGEDGLLINYNTQVPEHLAEMMALHQIPAVWLNTKQEADCVYPDDWQAGQLAAERLLELGHRRIAYVVYSSSLHYSAFDRAEGCRSFLRQNGLDLQVIQIPQEVKLAERVAYALAHLAAPEPPTAIVAYTPAPMGCMFGAAMRLGLRIPQDLSVMTIDVRPVEYCGMRVDTLLLPEYVMGQEAVDMLQQKMLVPAAWLVPRALPVAFAPGETCAPPGA
jgi:LacI family transcriptional regulator